MRAYYGCCAIRYDESLPKKRHDGALASDINHVQFNFELRSLTRADVRDHLSGPIHAAMRPDDLPVRIRRQAFDRFESDAANTDSDRALEKQLDAAGAPPTPGRLPDWKK